MDIESAKVIVLPDGRMNSTNASRYLGLAEKTLAMMRCEGSGPKFIKKGRIFYFKSDLDEWINEGGRVSSTAQLIASAVEPA